MPSRSRPPPPCGVPAVCTPFLQACLCTRGPGEGEVCPSCGCHQEVGVHNRVCTEDDCEGDGELLFCCACNLAYHRACMGTIHWGLDDARNAVPWCEECFAEWEECGIATLNVVGRGDTEVGYTLPARNDGPALGAEPLLSATKGRARVHFTRSGTYAQRDVPLVPCPNANCRME